MRYTWPTYSCKALSYRPNGQQEIGPKAIHYILTRYPTKKITLQGDDLISQYGDVRAKMTTICERFIVIRVFTLPR